MNSTAWQTLGGSLVLSSLIWTAAFDGTSRLAQATLAAEPTQLAQTSSVDVSALRSHLQAQDWQAADQETRRILQSYVHPNDDIFGSPLSTSVPVEVMQTLDQLWSEASDGKFGFQAQQQIWQETSAQFPSDSNVAARAFGDRVGWTRPERDPNNFVSPEWLTEPELNYSLNAPAGHLPWAGIDWARIESMLNSQSCGSCTVDAMYLQGERFTRYIPDLMNRAQVALAQSVPEVGSWAQPKLAQSINLRSLYPEGACSIRTASSALSPNGNILAVGSYAYERGCNTPGESALALWDARRGVRLITLHRGPALEAVNQGTPPQEPRSEGNRIVGDVANTVAFTPDGQFVAAGLANGAIRLWTVAKGDPVRIFLGHQYAVRAIAISPDGQTLISASADQTLKFWNLQTGELLRTVATGNENGIIETLLISPDGQRLAIATDRGVLQLRNAQSGQIIRMFVDASVNVSTSLPIAFSPDSQRLATTDIDHSVKLWNATTGARIITLKGHTEPVKSLAFSPDNQRLASASESSARLWNLQTYQSEHTFGLIDAFAVTDTGSQSTPPENDAQLAFSPDGRVLAAGVILQNPPRSEPAPIQGIALRDAVTGEQLSLLYEAAHARFSPDNQFLIADQEGGSGSVQIWQPYRSLVTNR